MHTIVKKGCECTRQLMQTTQNQAIRTKKMRLKVSELLSMQLRKILNEREKKKEKERRKREEGKMRAKIYSNMEFFSLKQGNNIVQ